MRRTEFGGNNGRLLDCKWEGNTKMNFQTVELFAVDLIQPAKKKENLQVIMDLVMIFRLNVNGQFFEKQVKY